MTYKRTVIAWLSVLLLLCLAACGKKEEDLKPDPAMPTGTESILQFYNDAIGRAVDGKLSFVKIRKPSDDKFNLAPVLSPFKDRMKAYTGIGEDLRVIVTPESAETDPYARYLQRPSLTAADVKKAGCTRIKGGLYRIELHLKDGESHVSPERNEYVSCLDRSGIVVGETIDPILDHRTAQNVHAQVCALAQDVRVDEENVNAVLIAVFRPDGTPVQLNIRFETVFDIKSVYEIGCSAKVKTVIRYLQFGADPPVMPEDDAV